MQLAKSDMIKRAKKNLRDKVKPFIEIILNYFAENKSIYKWIVLVGVILLIIAAFSKLFRWFNKLPNISDNTLNIIITVSVGLLTALAFVDDLAEKINASYFKTFLIKLFIISFCCFATYAATIKQHQQDDFKQATLLKINREYETNQNAELKKAIKIAQDSITTNYTTALLKFGLTWQTGTNKVIKSLTDKVNTLKKANTSYPDIDISTLAIEANVKPLTIDVKFRNQGSRADDINIKYLKFVSVNNKSFAPLDQAPITFFANATLSNLQELGRPLVITEDFYNVYYFIFFVSYSDGNGNFKHITLLKTLIKNTGKWGEPIVEDIPYIKRFFNQYDNIYKTVKL